MNKDVFSGFIQGVVAMYKQNSYLDPLLELRWDSYIRDNKCVVTCEYNKFICDRLVEVGDYDTPPQYETIRERLTMFTEVEISNNLQKMANTITEDILNILTFHDPNEI